jgi:multidrug resistance protein
VRPTSTRASGQSKLSRIATALTSRSKKERLARAKIPESNLENGIVGWDGQDDPEMPLNFAPSRKWLLLGLLSSITFVSPLASSMFAPAVSFADETFHNTSEILSTLSVTIFLLGYTVGPLLLAPLSEIYGRRYVLTAGNVIFSLFQIGCALAPNISALIVLRFLGGIGGSGCLTIGGGVIADLFAADQRGLATSLYSLGPLFGPIIGPICGGFIGERAGWRWVFWVLLIAAGSVSVGIEILNRETNHRVLIKRKVARLQKELNRPDLRSCYDPAGTSESATIILWHGILRPLKMLFFSPIVFLLSMYMAFTYGLLYVETSRSSDITDALTQT